VPTATSGHHRPRATLFDTRLKTFTTFRHNDSIGSIGNDHVTSLLIDNQQQLWAGCLNRGLNRFNPATKSFCQLRTLQPEKPLSLSQKSVNSLVEDRQGNLGTLRGGVNLYVPLAEKFRLYRQGLITVSITAIFRGLSRTAAAIFGWVPMAVV
jgi:ligand-binding sensor domain-containing protein